MKTSIIKHIARNLEWYRNLKESDEWMGECLSRIYRLNKELPNGSGIDAGCEIDEKKSTKNKIVISFGFHHMDENGMYDGWTNHDLIIRPDFDGFKIKITGPNRNFVKGYLYELFEYELQKQIEL
jgi:hypothetical protein